MFIRAAVLIFAVLVAQAASAQQGARVARIGYLTASHAMDDDDEHGEADNHECPRVMT